MRGSNLRWATALPIALLAALVLIALALDAAYGGEAKPAAFLGDSTPVRGTFIAPPATPTSLATTVPTPTARAQPGLPGTPADRDQRRRLDLLALLEAARKLKERDAGYPDTKNNVQTLCVFRDNDLGCAFKDTFGGDLPSDPAGDPVHNGYFYSSDGQTARFYALLEQAIPDDQRCQTDDKGLRERQNVICVTAP
jgi:hypothetical protein